jgi:hypothetical protein
MRSERGRSSSSNAAMSESSLTPACAYRWR